MMRAIGRIIRMQQEIRLQRTSSVEPPFNIMLDPYYWRVKFAGTESVQRSFRHGLGIVKQLNKSLNVFLFRQLPNCFRCRNSTKPSPLVEGVASPILQVKTLSLPPD